MIDKTILDGWFAWYPVKCDCGTWVWLKIVGRRICWIFHHEADMKKIITYEKLDNQ